MKPITPATALKRIAAPKPAKHFDVHEWHPDYESYHTGLDKVLPAVREFCSAILNHEQPRRWLSLLGPSGVGKTHILKQALRFLETPGRWKVKTRTGERSPQVAHIIPAVDLTDYTAARDYAKYDLIYIEDIGAGATQDKGAGAVTRSRIMELLQLRSGKWTMLDANLMRRDIASQLDGRIASRLKRDGSWMVEIPQEVPDFYA